MLRINCFRLLPSVVIGLAFLSVAAAQTNVAIVNTQRAILESAQIQAEQT